MDLSLADFLKTIGYQIDHIVVRQYVRKEAICFQCTDELMSDKNSYFNNEATVDPQLFSNNIRNLKSMINNEFALSSE